MEIDKLIEQLTKRAHLAAMNEDTTNAKYKRLFDDAEANK